jgi:glycerophosphoryl diester phosphodiesterase
MKPYLSHEHPIRLAHRGSRVLWPENTMVAFQGAVDLGYRYLETDVRADRDGTLYLFHDKSVDSLTDGTGPIREMSGAEVGALDAAHWFDPGNGYPLRGSGIGIPRVEEVLTTFPDVLLNIDLKGAGVASLLPGLLHKLRAEERVLAGGFLDWRISRFRRRTGGRVATSAGPLQAGAIWLASRVRRGVRASADALQVPESARGLKVVDTKLVAAAHAAGIQVHVWTVDDPTAMHRLLDLGVDGIVTDRPDVLNEVLSAREPPA